MKRAIVLGALIVVSALSLVIVGQQAGRGGGAQQAPRVVEVEKLKENLFVLKGGGDDELPQDPCLQAHCFL